MKRAFLFISLCTMAVTMAACGRGGSMPKLGSAPSQAATGPGPASGSVPNASGSVPNATFDFGNGLYEPNVARVCPDASTLPAGKMTCMALLRIDLGGGSKNAYHGTDFARAKRAFVAAAAASTPNPITNTGADAPYGPAELQATYNLPSSTMGAGSTVAIVDAYDQPYVESDMNVYRSNFNLPACTTANGCFKKVNEHGAPSPLPSPDPGWAGEISLDVEMVSAVCPNCKIILVEASDDFDAAENTAVQLGAKYISNSYGGAEQQQSDPAYDSHPGVVITAASGDSGYKGIAGTFQPASFNNVISVGGTALYPDTTTTRGWTEIAWRGAGSGCSQLVNRPTYQSDVGCSATKFDGKAVADIAAVADPFTGIWVYQSYPGLGWSDYGGTSVASPIVAAAYALAGNAASIGPGATSVWKAAGTAALNDVQAGITAPSCTPTFLCVSGPGFDGPTGWGTPHGLGAL